MDELHQELIDALKIRDKCQVDYAAFIAGYKVELADRKKSLAAAVRRVEQIEAAMVDPDKAMPLLAAAERNVAAVARGEAVPTVGEAVRQAMGIMERAAEAETATVLAARKANRGGGKPKDEGEVEPKRVPLPDGDLVRQPGGNYAADPPPPATGKPAKPRGRKKPPADGKVREPVIGGGGPNRQLDGADWQWAPKDGRWDVKRITEAIEALEGVGALERAARHQNLPLVLCDGCGAMHHVKFDPCPCCRVEGVKSTVIRAVLYDLGVWTPAREEAVTRHWDVHRFDEDAKRGLGPRIGGQIARNLEEAKRLAAGGWPGDLRIGDSHPHGPDCGCGEGPEPPAAKPAVRKPDPHAAELAADTAKATDAVKLWAVHRYDDKSPKHRGDRIGSIRAVDRLEAAQLAAEVRTWTAGGVVLIGEELVDPGAKPVANLGQLDHPESNRRIADRLIGRSAEKASGKPHRPGPMNQDDALLQACDLPEVRDELGRLTAEGGADNEILEALAKWPRILKTYPNGTGNPWATTGGVVPKFYYDSDVDSYGRPAADYRGATLHGEDLVKATRRNLHIPRPRPSRADGQSVRVRKPKGPKPAEATP